MSKTERFLCAAIVTLIPWLVLMSGFEKSVVIGEPEALLAGYRSIKNGPAPDGQPYTVRISGQVAFVFSRVFNGLLHRFPDRPFPEAAQRFVTTNAQPHAILFSGRLPFAFVSLMAGLFVFWAAKSLYGTPSGLLALLLYALNPSLLSYARYCTADLTGAAGMFAATFFFIRFLRTGCRTAIGLGGLALGVALVSAELMIVLVPAFVLILLLHHWAPQQKEPGHTGLRASLIGLAAILLIGGGLIWACYRFEWSGGIPAASYFAGIGRMLGDGSGGDWGYFPVALFERMPPGMTALLAVGLATALWRPTRRLWHEGLYLVPPLLLLAGATLWSAQDGARPVLAVVPFVTLLASRLLAGWDTQLGRMPGPARLALAGLLSVWTMASLACIFPHYQAYSNELVGESQIREGQQVDQGQDLIHLAHYLQEHRIDSGYSVDTIQISYYGPIAPRYYLKDIQPVPFTDRDPFPPSNVSSGPTYNFRYIAISVHNLRALSKSNRSLYDRFDALKPIAILGHTIHLYRVPEPNPEPSPGAD